LLDSSLVLAEITGIFYPQITQINADFFLVFLGEIIRRLHRVFYPQITQINADFFCFFLGEIGGWLSGMYWLLWR